MGGCPRRRERGRAWGRSDGGSSCAFLRRGPLIQAPRLRPHFLCHSRAVPSACSCPPLSLLSELHELPERGEEPSPESRGRFRQSPRMGPGALAPATGHQGEGMGFGDSTHEPLAGQAVGPVLRPWNCCGTRIVSQPQSQASPCARRALGTFPILPPSARI